MCVLRRSVCSWKSRLFSDEASILLKKFVSALQIARLNATELMHLTVSAYNANARVSTRWCPWANAWGKYAQYYIDCRRKNNKFHSRIGVSVNLNKWKEFISTINSTKFHSTPQLGKKKSIEIDCEKYESISKNIILSTKISRKGSFSEESFIRSLQCDWNHWRKIKLFKYFLHWHWLNKFIRKSERKTKFPSFHNSR